MSRLYFLLFVLLTLATTAHAAPEGAPCTAQSPQVITYGALITCDANDGGPALRLIWHARVGETIDVQLTGELLQSGRGFPCLRLLHADGSVLVGDYRHCGLRVRIVWTMPKTADFIVEVSTDDVTRGRYAISLERVTPPTDNMPLTNGERTDSLDPEGDVDLSIQPMAADDAVTARLIPLGPTSAVGCLDIIQPDGRPLRSTCGLGTLTVNGYARIAGAHVIRVSSENFAKLLYRLEVRCEGWCSAPAVDFIEQSRPCAPPWPIAIASGDNIQCSLTTNDSPQDYVFRGVGGTTIAARVSRTGRLGVPCAEILDTRDASLKYTCDASAAQLVIAVPADGVFRVRVTNRSNAALSYVLAFEQLTGTNATAVPLALSQTTFDRLPAPGAVRSFRFNGLQRHTVLVFVTQPDSPASVVVELYRSDGSLLARAGNLGGPNATILLRLPATETYSVLVYDPTLTFLTFGVTVHELTPPSGAALKVTTSVAGKLRNYGDQHLYIFDAVRASTVSVTLPQTSGGQVCATVYDPLANVMATDCHYHQLTLRLSVSGTYAILIFEGGAQLTGRADYTLALSCSGCMPVRHPLMSTIRTLPVGVVSVPYYEQQLLAFGGTPPYEWSLASGALPMGLTLSSVDGVVSGTPSQAGRFDVVIAITDSRRQTFGQAFSFLITDHALTCSVLSTSGARIMCDGRVLFEGGYGAGGGRGLNLVVMRPDGSLRLTQNFDTYGRGAPAFQDFLTALTRIDNGDIIFVSCGDDCSFWRRIGTPSDPVEQTMQVLEQLGAHFVRKADGSPNVGYRDSYILVARKADRLALAEAIGPYDQTNGWALLTIDVHFSPNARTIDPTTLRIINETSAERNPIFRVNDRWALEMQNTEPNATVFLHAWHDGQDLGVSGPYGRSTDTNGAWRITGIHASTTIGFWNLQAINAESQDRSDIISFAITER